MCSDADRATFKRLMSTRSAQQRSALQVLVISSLPSALDKQEIIVRRGTQLATTRKWRWRFSQTGIASLAEAPRSDKPALYDAGADRRILEAPDETPSAGNVRWNGSLPADNLEDISKHHILCVLRQHEISSQRRRRWCMSGNPEFAQRPGDIVGLHLNPPENAVVLFIS